MNEDSENPAAVAGFYFLLDLFNYPETFLPLGRYWVG